jgi:hypothetical protein
MEMVLDENVTFERLLRRSANADSVLSANYFGSARTKPASTQIPGNNIGEMLVQLVEGINGKDSEDVAGDLIILTIVPPNLKHLLLEAADECSLGL